MPTILPLDIRRDWSASVVEAEPNEHGVIRLVGARRTRPKSFEEQRVIVRLIDENGFPVPDQPVVFAYTTGDDIEFPDGMLWVPPPPFKALVVPTGTSGQIDQIQGSVVKEGQPGGITVYILDPKIPSDAVVGAGMLPDHTGLCLTFQRYLKGVLTLQERLGAIDAWISNFESGHRSIVTQIDEIKKRLAALEAK